MQETIEIEEYKPTESFVIQKYIAFNCVIHKVVCQLVLLVSMWNTQKILRKNLAISDDIVGCFYAPF